MTGCVGCEELCRSYLAFLLFSQLEIHLSISSLDSREHRFFISSLRNIQLGCRA